MKIQLLHGQFKANEALDIITQMIHIKIKHHENKINNSSNEEDVKNREAKIKRLQKDLFEIRKHIEANGKKINLESIIEIDQIKLS
jgi:hypothetical protein